MSTSKAISKISPKPKQEKVKQPKQKQPKQKPIKVKSNAPPGIPQGYISNVCGLIDPFCPHARGTKFLDDSSARTLPFTCQWNEVLTTDTYGSVAKIFTPKLSSDGSGMTNSGSMTGAVFNPNAAYDAAQVGTLSGASRYRIVSAGVRIKRISPLLNTAGLLYVRSFATTNMPLSVAVTVNTYAASQIVNQALVDVTDTTIILEHSNQMPQIFYPLTDNAFQYFEEAGFNPLLISVMGAPASTAVAFIEYIVHLEYIFDDNSPLALAATPSPVFNSVISTVAKKISSESDNFFSKAINITSAYVKKKATDYLLKAFSASPDPRAKLLGAAGSMIMNVD